MAIHRIEFFTRMSGLSMKSLTTFLLLLNVSYVVVGTITWCILPIVFQGNPIAQNSSLAAGQCLMGVTGVIVTIYMAFIGRKLVIILSTALNSNPDSKMFVPLRVKFEKFTRFFTSSAVNGGIVAMAIPIWMIISSSKDGHGMSYFMYVWGLFLTPTEVYLTLFLWWMSNKIGGGLVTPENVSGGAGSGSVGMSNPESKDPVVKSPSQIPL